MAPFHFTIVPAPPTAQTLLMSVPQRRYRLLPALLAWVLQALPLDCSQACLFPKVICYVEISA